MARHRGAGRATATDRTLDLLTVVFLVGFMAYATLWFQSRPAYGGARCLPIPAQVADVYELERPVRLKHPAREPTQLWQVMEREHVARLGPEERRALLGDLQGQLMKLRVLKVDSRRTGGPDIWKRMRVTAGILDEDLVAEVLPERRRRRRVCVRDPAELEALVRQAKRLGDQALELAIEGMERRGRELELELFRRRAALVAAGHPAEQPSGPGDWINWAAQSLASYAGEQQAQ